MKENELELLNAALEILRELSAYSSVFSGPNKLTEAADKLRKAAREVLKETRDKPSCIQVYVTTPDGKLYSGKYEWSQGLGILSKAIQDYGPGAVEFVAIPDL